MAATDLKMECVDDGKISVELHNDTSIREMSEMCNAFRKCGFQTHYTEKRRLVSEETVVLRRWRSKKPKFG